MNLQESIKKILREDKDHTNLLKGIIDSSDIFDYKHFCGFDIITPEERSDQYNFLNKNKIPYLIKVYFVGGPNSEVWPRTQAIRNKELDLMEELHEYIKSFVPFNIEMMGSHVNSCEGYKKLMKRKYSTDDLQESIKRILREEDYSPAGKEVTPNKIVIHKSNPIFRDKIIENGLKVRAGECYKIYVGYGVKCKPAIFATNSTNKRAWFDSTYDDDIWEINTEMIPDVKWYKDRHFESRSKHIVTFQDIPKEAITLKYEGSGSGDVEKWDKNSPNIVRESIRRIIKEESKLSPLIRRRVPHDDLEREFEESLDMSSNMLRNVNNGSGEIISLNKFINVTTSILMDGIHHELYSTIRPEKEWYNEAKESLEEYYKDRINDRYRKLISEM